MAGTREGGIKAAKANLASDPQFYHKIGAKGGRNGNTGGFASDVECNCSVYDYEHYKRNCAGYKGGVKSRRTKQPA